LDGGSSNEVSVVEKARLRDFASAITDIRAMEAQMRTLWRQEVSMMVPELSDEEGSESELSLEG
jgi:conserved oligomeric Golgi complex subunit 2